MNDEINRKLLSAVEYGELEGLRNLLDQYELGNSEANGYVLLRRSIILKSAEITKLLLCRGSRVNSKRSKLIPSNTPLHFAVQNGDMEIIDMLLDCNADIDAKNDEGLTPLLCAISMGKEHIVDLLLKRGSWLNNCTVPSPLYVAVKRGLYKMTNKLLQLGVPVDLNPHSVEQYTPLLCALETGADISIVELLLKHGANVNSKTTGGLTSLHFASKRGNIEIIKLLLNGNADVNARSTKHLTPLYFAVENSHREASKYLMDHGADIDAEFESGKTVLNLAVCKDLSMIVEDILKYCPDRNNTSNKDSVKIVARKSYGNGLVIVQNLLKYGFSVDAEDVNVLIQNAIGAGYVQIIEHLIMQRLHLACFKEQNCNFLHIAAKYKQVEIAKLLLTHGADVNGTDEAGKHAIYYATEKSDISMTKLLLSHGASVQKSPELLRVATRKVCKEIVEILLQNKVDIEATDEHGRTALHLTALSEYDGYAGSLLTDDEPNIKAKAEITKLLLSMGANVNAKTKKDKLTALHMACKKGFTYVVEVLLEYKADVNFFVKDCSPLMIAAQQGNASIIKMLISNGANVNSKRENGDTALHILAKKSRGKLYALEILLKNGADVYSKNSRGATPLHEASKQSNLDTISMLLQHGSPVDSKDIEGNTPLHIAVQVEEREIIKLLLNSGSDINICNNNNYTVVDIAKVSQFYSRTRCDYFVDDSENEDFDLDRYDNFEYENVLEILRLHLIMLNTANLYVVEKNLDFMNADSDYSTISHKENCEEEINQLKIKKISNNKLSFFDILTKNIHSLASYARNDDIIKIFESDHYKSEFPIYGRIMERNFEKGKRRRLLLEQTLEFFKYYFELPYDCSDQISRYLSDADLENVVNVLNTPSQFKDF